MMRSMFCVGLVVAFLSCCYAAASFSFCKLSDPDIDACIAKNIEKALPLLKAGIPEYGLKSFDPYPVDNLTIGAGSGAVNLVQYYKNIELLGLTVGTVSKAHYNEKKKTLQVIVNFPKVTQQGNYVVNGAILSLPVTGDGKSTLILHDLDVAANIKFEETQKAGKIYFKIKAFLVSLKPKRMQMNFENLFNGNKLLGDNINKLINEEWQVLFDDVRADTEKNYGEIFKGYSQTFFDNVPVEELFLK